MSNRTNHLLMLLDALGDAGAKHDERPALEAIAAELDTATVEGLTRLLSRLARWRRQTGATVASLEREVLSLQRTYEKLNAQVTALGDQLDGERAAREAMLAALEGTHRASADMERRRGDDFAQGMAAGALASLEAARNAAQGVAR